MIHLQVLLPIPCYDFYGLPDTTLGDLSVSLTTVFRVTWRQFDVGSSDGRCVQKAGTYSWPRRERPLRDVPRSRGRIPILDPNRARSLQRLARPFGRADAFESALHDACSPERLGAYRPTIARAYSQLSQLSLFGRVCAGALSTPLKDRERYRAKGLRTLSERTRQITSRTGGGHAPPLQPSAKTFGLCIIGRFGPGEFSGVESN